MERGLMTALSVQNLEVLRGDRRILNDVGFSVAPGEVVALMGPSGAGKSTILRAISALEPITAGTITTGSATLVAGVLPPESRLTELRRRVGIVFQSPSLFDHMTALENVTLAPVHVLGWTRDRAEAVARDLLGSLGVDHRMNAYPRALSGGEAQRVAIARALAPDPAVLLMDEPTSALDPARRGALGESLRKLATAGRALLLSTHDAEFAREFADRVLTLSDGSLR
jgi:ABC-type polar amino acid transport system ATPase subunit